MLDDGEEIGHFGNCAYAEERHAAVRDAADSGDFEPIDAAMSEADAVDVQGFGDDDEVGAAARDQAVLGEVGHAGESAAFFVDRAALFDRATETHSGAADGFDGEDGGGDAGLLVGCAAAEDLAIRQGGTEGIDRPAVADWDDVKVTVEMEQGACGSVAQATNDVYAWIFRGVFGAAFGWDILDVVAELCKTLSEPRGAGGVVVAGRIHGGDGD